jgi:hypothetical protein
MIDGFFSGCGLALAFVLVSWILLQRPPHHRP